MLSKFQELFNTPKRILFKSIFFVLTFIVMLTSCNNQHLGIVVSKPQNIGNNIGNLFMLTFGLVTYDDSNVYYISFKEQRSSLNKLSFSGKKTELSNNLCLYLNVIDNWIYYINADDNKIYKMDTDGNYIEKISDIEVAFLYAYGDLLYTIGDTGSSFTNLYTMNFDGTDLKVLSEDNINQMQIEKDNIYYLSPHDGKQTLFKIDLDGNNKEVIEDGKPMTWFCVYKDNVFYNVSEQKIMRFNITDKSDNLITPQFPESITAPTELMNIQDNIVIYRELNKGTLNQLNLDTNEITSWNDKNKKNEVEANSIVYHTNMYIMGLVGLYPKRKWTQ